MAVSVKGSGYIAPAGAGEYVGGTISVPSDADAIYIFIAGGNGSTSTQTSGITLGGVSPGKELHATVKANNGGGTSAIAADSIRCAVAGWRTSSSGTGSKTLSVTWANPPSDGAAAANRLWNILWIAIAGNDVSADNTLWRDAVAQAADWNLQTTANTITSVGASNGDFCLAHDSGYGVLPGTPSGWTSELNQATTVNNYGSRISSRTATGSYSVASTGASWDALTSVAIALASSDVTLGLIGQSVSGDTGILVLQSSPALTGSSASITAGTLGIIRSNSLDGLSSAVSVGFVSPLITLAATGSAVTTAAGTLTSSTSKLLSGSSITQDAGLISVAHGVGLTGEAASVSPGLLTPSVSLGLSGQAITTATGVVTVQTGSDVNVALTGQFVTIEQGSVTVARALSLQGSAIAIQSGLMGVTRSTSLQGTESLLSAGLITANRSIDLSGSSVVIDSGTLTVQTGNDISIALTGQAVTLVAGSLSVTRNVLLQGEPVILDTGTITAARPRPAQARSTAIPVSGVYYNRASSMVAGGEAPLRAGAGGVSIGRFGWAEPDGRVLNSRVSAQGMLGLVVIQYGDWRKIFWDEETSTWKVREGLPITMLTAAPGVWVSFAGGVSAGDRVYADPMDGLPVAGYAAGLEATRWVIGQPRGRGDLSLITTWNPYT